MLTDDPAVPLILVVEDDNSHTHLIKRSFEDAPEKYRLECVVSLGAARTAIERQIPDLVLTDYRLPDGEGSELLVTARSLCPVVLMTSQGNEQVAVAAMKAGVQDYVVKSSAVFPEISRIIQRDLREWALIQGQKQADESLRVHQIELELRNEELRHTQAELNAERSRYFDLYDLAPVGYLTIGEDGKILEANLAAASILGVVKDALLRNPITQFILREDHDIYYLLRKKIIKENKGQLWEMRLQRADGSPFWAHLHVTSVHNGEYMVALTDITERKRSEEERHILEQQFQQAQKLESLGVLAGGIAHDFNNILTVIICNCSLLQKTPQMAEVLVPEIETAAQRAADLCRQMLIYAGKAQPIRTKFNVKTLVEEMVKMLKATITQNVAITLDLSADIPPIKADASQIRQVVMNLIINASEAIGTVQGNISVSLVIAEIEAGQSEKDYLGKIITPGSYICLNVTDNGCGMDEDTKQRLFEPFYTTKFPGRGLGMSAVLGIIKAHNGALQLTSQQGHGTTFKVYFPFQCSEPVGDLLPRVSLMPWQGSGTVLLVDDEPQLIMVAKALLKALGFSVIEASNGKVALEMYQKNAQYITLVLTDIGMPVMDGYELIRELKIINPELPIIVSSGFGDAEVTFRIRENIAGSVSKPYSYDHLRDVLRRVVEGYAAKQARG